MARPLPETFGRYRILRPLGEGGMGAVYLARDTQLDRLVALKVPRLGGDDQPAADDLKRFFREARAAAALMHSNLCPIFDVGQIDGTPYLTMAYLEGRLLSDLVVERKRLSQRQATLIVRKLALAMQEAHARGVIHRDLKPSNVMISPHGEPVVMDFGLARLDQTVEARLTKDGTVLGTPAYMPPEQIQGDPRAIGPACDIYALGVIFYEILTGQLPFEGSVLSVLGKILTQDPPPPSKHRPDLDPQFEAICLKAMAKKAEDRYASMADLAAALTQHLRATQKTPRPAPVSGTEPAADPGSYAGVDSAATGAPETLFARHEPEGPPPPGEVPAPRPGWRDHERKPRRTRPLLSGWLLYAVAGGAVSLLLIGSAIFVSRSNDVPAPNRPPFRSAPPSTQPEPQPAPPISKDVVKNQAESKNEAHPHIVKKDVEPKKETPLPIVKKDVEPKKETPLPVVKKEPEVNKATPAPVVKKEPELNKATPLPLVKKEAVPKKATPAPVVESEFLTTRVGQIQLKRIPAGTFLMGSPDGEGFPNEHPRREVRISRTFYLGVFEVTQAQYHAVMAENPSWYSVTGGGKGRVAGQSTDQHPVHNVSWRDALRFCNTLSQRENLKPFYQIDGDRVQVLNWNGTGYRLPTEAEWEYACRAQVTNRYHFGDGEKALSEYAWYERSAGGKTHPVGQKRPNTWGLHDMHGNVWEWCWDWYDEHSYQHTSNHDPTGPPKGTHRVLRGGSFNDFPAVLRSATRGRDLPANRDGYNGLRVARTYH